MRARNLKPGFFKNEILASLQPATRLLFAGLWLLADRKGRLEDRPQRIKAELFPYDDWNIDVLMSDLDSNGFIKRYSINGFKYIEILNFQKHQRPHIKEPESEIPAPNEQQTKPKRTPKRHQRDTKETPNVPDQFVPLPPSPFPITDNPLPSTDGFEVFWKSYPRKTQKGYAKKIWLKIKPDDSLLKRMLDKIQLLKKTEQWKKDNGKYIPYPSTWLNGEGWEDEVPQPNIETDYQKYETPEWMKEVGIDKTINKSFRIDEH